MAITEYEQQIVDNVSEHGWHCVGVGGSDEEPGFAYSVGFWETLAAPEFIIFGLPHKLMHSMLWEAFEQIKTGKAPSLDRGRWSGLIEGFDCISRPVHPTQIVREHFNSALWHRRHRMGNDEGLSACQLFWPGSVEGLFPWESDCAQIVRDHQPLLYLPCATGIA